jgi:hypothetical protein
MQVTLTGVLVDGAVPVGTIEPSVPTVQPISWPAGEDGTITLEVVGSDGQPINLTGGAVYLAVRRHAYDEDVEFNRLGELAPQVDTDGPDMDPDTEGDNVTGTPGVATFTIHAADTQDLAVAPHVFDVQYVDADSNRAQLVPVSDFRILETAGRADDDSDS